MDVQNHLKKKILIVAQYQFTVNDRGWRINSIRIDGKGNRIIDENGIAEIRNKFDENGTVIIGVSPDEVKKQNNFANKFGFNYNLIADDSKKLIEAFGVWGKQKFMGKEYFGVIRTTFIINEKGLIERIIEKVNTKEHSSQILADD